MQLAVSITASYARAQYQTGGSGGDDGFNDLEVSKICAWLEAQRRQFQMILNINAAYTADAVSSTIPTRTNICEGHFNRVQIK